MSLLAASSEVPVSIRPPTVRHYATKTKAVIALVRYLLSANPAEDPPDLDVGHLNQLQGPCFLQQDIRSTGISEGSLS